MKLLNLLPAALLLLSAVAATGQTTEFMNLNVVQNDVNNNTTSVTVTKAAGSSPNMNLRTGSNRGGLPHRHGLCQ
jgi:hypothetical protein